MRLRVRAATLLLTLLGLWPAAAAAGGPPPDPGDAATLRAGEDMALAHTLDGRPLDAALRRQLAHCTGQTPPSAQCLDAVMATGLHARNDLGYLFYDPAQPLQQDLGHGAHLTLPAGALATPTMFIVGVHPGIDAYPLVNIVPDLPLNSAATLTLQPQDVRRYRQWMPDLPESGDQTQSRTLRLSRTGVIINGQLQEGSDRQAMGGLVQRIIGKPRTLDPCLHSLTDPETTRKIAEQARQGISLPQGCRFVPPYVHIAVTEGSDAAPMQTELVFRTGPDELQLFRLEAVKGFTVLINGFLWHGDPGTGAGQGGWAMGYARGLDVGDGSGRLTIGDNTWQKRTPGQLQQQTQRTAGTGRKRVVRFATAPVVLGHADGCSEQLARQPGRAQLLHLHRARRPVCAGRPDHPLVRLRHGRQGQERLHLLHLTGPDPRRRTVPRLPGAGHSQCHPPGRRTQRYHDH